MGAQEPELTRGFELLFRNVDELEKFLKLEVPENMAQEFRKFWHHH